MNMYSENWFEAFYHNFPDEWTTKDVESLGSILTLPDFSKILDVGCGYGRISGRLSNLGYEVLGIDNHLPAVTKSATDFPLGKFKFLDMYDLDELPENHFDSILFLWHSFGYRSDEENSLLFPKINRRLRLGGLAIFDLYNPAFVSKNAGPQKTRGEKVTSATLIVSGERLTNIFTYEDGNTERISFQLYDLPSISSKLNLNGFRIECVHAFWEKNSLIDDSVTRFQVVAVKESNLDA